MKSEQRHKLQQNELAEWLTGVINVVRPYANAILAVILLGVVVLGLWKWWQAQSASAASAAWNEIYAAAAAQDTATLDRIMEQNPGTEAAYWAAVLSADLHLAAGCQDLFSNKASARQELRKAVEKYLLVRNESRTSALRDRATFGLARAYEALGGTRQSEGELAKAVDTYEEVTRKWPKGAFAAAAETRAADLQTQATKAFYDKFAQYDPQPAFSNQPGGQTKPLFDSKSLPEDGSVPDFSKVLGEGTTAGKESAKPVKTGPADLEKIAPGQPKVPAEAESEVPGKAEAKAAPDAEPNEPAKAEPKAPAKQP